MVYAKDPNSGQLLQFNTQADADAYVKYAQARTAGQETLTGEGQTQATANIEGAESRYQNDFDQQHPGLSDPYSYQYGGDPLWAQRENDRLQAQAQGYADRASPTIDTSGMQPFSSAASGAATGAGMAGLGLANVANGAGYQGQMAAGTAQQGAAASQVGAGDALMKLSQMPSGPSAAEMAMKRTIDQASSQQASLAAGARGGNAALAMQNAAANEAQIGGQGARDIGTQRASEDLANRTFAANAASMAGQTYGGAGSTYGGAGSTFGGAAQTQTGALTGAAGAFQGQGGINATLSGQYGQIASDNASNAVKSTAVNDSSQMQAQQMGYGLMGHQLDQNANFDTGIASRSAGAAESAFANRDKTGEGTITGSAGGDKALGAGITALGAVAAMSDIRAKKNIVPADEKVSDAFRGMGQDLSPDGSALIAVPGRAPMVRSAQAQGQATAMQPYPYTNYSYGGNELRPVPMSPTGMSLSDLHEFSDINAKKNITYAPGAISDAFRTAGESADTIRGTDAEYPDLGGYGYDYKDPNQPGARPGRNYGPMAQELERTPAGASVVKDTPRGKAIDTSRLSLLNASETSKLRREVDALKQGQPIADEIRGTDAEYPMYTDRGRGPTIAPTDLVYSSENGGNFRTPDEQLAYVDSVKRRPQATPLFYDPSGEGTFRTPLEQLRYANALKSGGAQPTKMAKTEEKIGQLAATDTAEEARIKKLRAQLAGSIDNIDQSPSAPTDYSAPVAYGY